jgi:putative nucleotidyltransferase with HDIG domain
MRPIERIVSARARTLTCLGVGLNVLAVGGIVALSGIGSWNPWLLLILAVLIIGANLVTIETKRISISGDSLGLLISMALLGPAQAAVLGALSSVVWLLRDPPRKPLIPVVLAGHAICSLVAGLVMYSLGRALGLGLHDLAYAVPIGAGFAVWLACNVALTFGSLHLLDAVPFWERIRGVVVPVLPSEAAMVLLASITVYAEAHLGALALAMLVALFFLYLHLLRELTVSQQRAEELGKRTEQLAALQVGVLTAMLRTLSMRDQMTARHSAAVARYAREIAKAAGCSEEEQDLVHTAGLLHDIGKFILPDHILLADRKLDDDDWQLIRMHPFQGAKVVREVEGYGPIADIIWAHHERIDGRGYPRGLSGDEIPRLSRMISIADTYDVMTARDSYRDPVSSEAAIAELRRVSGAQLDGELVEIFIAVLAEKGVAFRHADDADFEAELSFERRVRDYAAPRIELPIAA